MRIGSVTSMSGVSDMRTISAGSTEPKGKRIQNEIINVRQRMQNLSSKGDLSANEKTNEREKLRKELSSLNMELKQYQEDFRKSQRKEIMTEKLQEDREPDKAKEAEGITRAEETSPAPADEKNRQADAPSADGQQTERQGNIVFRSNDGVVILKDEVNQDDEPGVNTGQEQTDESRKNISEKTTGAADDDKPVDAGLSRREIHAMVSADTSVRQADRLGTVIARTSDGITILKGEIEQDEKRGMDTERKQAELEKMEKAKQRAIAFQSSILGEANGAMGPAAAADGAEAKNGTRSSVDNAFINAMNVSQEQESQQKLYVSFF